ncbi:MULTISPECIES: UDP-N-acetyl-D-mannosamine dehydrogenase [Kocuria]|uniref:UDP-N-acetyl-D-mannosamine dehydrogenase n=1 Tax=Kocuria subflava TaxID=1736139 RepID=A0A846U852_9MICC|nr:MULTISPECIES: UDP-N-acetyl-D-mannosamine dehydrogenase [Kocuria]NKE09766.1 UDP-N-acetyl-D-mannosamine dehydrogenase [Kocuria subflava]
MAHNQQTVVFVGLGYIGLPTAVTLANSGVQVRGVDVNTSVVERVSRGEVTIVEPGLEEELKKAVDSGNLTAHTEMQSGDAYVIAVPTPFKENYEGDTSYIEAAAANIAPLLEGDELVILESTSPPLTTRKLAEVLIAARPDLTVDPEEAAAGQKKLIHLAYCPERILPGRAMEELITNDRIIGGMTPEAAKRGRAVYETFCKGELLETDDVTAEMAKLTENSFRDVNIAFANELSLISDKLGIDVWELIELANHHPRVNILQPGPGVGGHCIAVDPWFIVSSDRENSNLIRTAREVNDGKPHWVINKVKEAASHKESPVIAALGLAFKANIDDLRESPAVNITKQLAASAPNATVLAVEPNVTSLPKSLEGVANIEFAQYREAIDRADVVLLLVDHDEFKDLPATALAGKEVVDTKGLWR